MAPPELTQSGRPIQVTRSPLSDINALIAMRLVGSEGLSQPFRFLIDFVSGDPAIAASKVFGKPMSFIFHGRRLKTKSNDVTTTRVLNGRVSRWADLGVAGTAGFAHYRAELVPELWMHSLSSDCRTFEEKSVKAIVEKVFSDLQFTNFKFRLAAQPPTLPYVVQYQETNLAFVSRMLEEHGLYYTFEHTSDKHTLIISDSKGSIVPAGTMPEILMASSGNGLLGRLGRAGGKKASGAASEAVGGAVGSLVGSVIGPLGSIAGGLAGGAVADVIDKVVGLLFGDEDEAPPADTITELLRERAVHTKTVATRDAHLLRAADTGSENSSDPGVTGEAFEFLGDLAGSATAGVSAATAKLRIEAIETSRDVLRGSSTAPTLMPGTRVKLVGGPLGASGEELHITEVGHVMEAGDVLSGDQADTLKYANEFTAVPIATQIRPPRTIPHPSVHGTQTALVVGDGEAGDIDVDKNGCVRLRFPWDRGDGFTKKSEHRVHVASRWAGAGWGDVALPRLGQIVLVEFLDGDPDRPIVVGRLYSKDHAHPYALPANKTQSGLKTRSVPNGGAANFNELRFEDKKGSEQVFLHAEKNLDVSVENDETWSTGHDRTEVIEHNHKMTLTKGDQLIKLTEGNQALLVIKGDQVIEDKEGRQALFTVDGEQLIRIEKGPQEFLVDDGDRTVTVKSGNNTKAISGTDQTTADTIKMEAETKIELKCGSSKIVMTTSKIEISVGGQKVVLDTSAVTVNGAKIDVVATGPLKASGAMTTVEGTGMLTMKGPMVQVKADGLLKLAGGVIMQN